MDCIILNGYQYCDGVIQKPDLANWLNVHFVIFYPALVIIIILVGLIWLKKK